MDASVIEALKAIGIDRKHGVPTVMPFIPIERDQAGKIVIPRESVRVCNGDQRISIPLKGVRELFSGTKQPPSLAGKPPAAYQPFLWIIERTATDYCHFSGDIATDEEFARVYRDLLKKPDGKSPSALFHHVRAACRLYMSLENISQAEFEAIADRLYKSARTFSVGDVSRNYYENVSRGVRLQ